MIININNPPLHAVAISRKGENEFREIVIDVSSWLSEYPDGKISVIYCRPDGELYPVIVNAAESPIIWRPTATDTAVSGVGAIEVRIQIGDVLGKSCMIRANVLGALGAPGVTPAAPAPDWAQTVTEDADRAEAAAEKVEAASTHMPQISENKTWLVWDANAGEYVDTGVSVVGEIPEVDDTLTQPGQPADAAAVGNRLSVLSEEIADGVSWNELKDKPFYLEKTLFIALTKDDFTVNDQDGRISYMYRSTPKLDWFVSADSIAFEIEIVCTDGRRYTATQDSLDVSIENDNTDEGYEYWSYYSGLFDIVSGVDLDFYDDEYYYKDEWGVLVDYYGIEFSEINIKIYRVDVKKIPEICLDAAIGKTAITVGSVLYGSEGEMPTNVVVPDLLIPISPPHKGEEIYCDRISGRLRVSGNLFPYEGKVDYAFPHAPPTTAGSSISFDISSEGDTLWDTVGMYSPWYFGRYLFFDLTPGRIRFLSRGPSPADIASAVASSNSGHLYTVVFKYTNNNKTLNVTIKCVA